MFNIAAMLASPKGLSPTAFRRRLFLAFSLPPLLLALLAVGLGLVINDLIRASRMVDHSDEVIAQTLAVQKLLLDRETGLRGYLLTGEGDFLEPYNRSEASLDAELARLHLLVDGDDVQRSRVDALMTAARKWNASAKAGIERASRQPSVAHEVLADARFRKEGMDAMRALVDSFLAYELNQKGARTARSREAAATALGAGVIVTLVFGIVLRFAVRRLLLPVLARYAHALAAAEDALRSRDEFLSAASHELRTPLTPLRLQLSALLNAAEGKPSLPSELVVDRVRAAQGSLTRLLALIEQLLEVQELHLGDPSARHQSVDAVATLGEVLQVWKAESGKKGSELKAELPGDTLRVPGTEQKLRRLMSELISNAVKFGKGEPVDISLRGDRDRVIFSVHDRGAGIPEAQRDRVFDRFARLQTDRGGLGLGLWLCRRIAEEVGGSIVATGGEGGGTTITVSLPRAV